MFHGRILFEILILLKRVHVEVILAGFAGGHIYPKERCYACFSMLLLFTATSEVYSAFVSELRRGDSYLDAF